MASFIVLDDYLDNTRAFAAATVIADDQFDIPGLVRSGCALAPLTAEIEAMVPGFLAQRSHNPSASFVAILAGGGAIGASTILVAQVTASSSVNVATLTFVDTTLGDVVLSLPLPSVGAWATFKKVSTDTHEIQVQPTPAASVEANIAGTAFTLPSSDSALLCSWNLVCDGTDWWLV